MADMMDDYSTADILARTPGSRGMTERERRRLMQRQRAGLDLMAEDERALENDAARRGAVSGEVADAGLGLMAEATGVPSIVRGGHDVKRGWDEGSGLRMAAGAGQMALGVMPGASFLSPTKALVGAALSNPVRGAAIGGATALPQSLLNISDARAASPDAEIRDRIARMNPQELMAYQKMIGATPDGKPGGETIMRAMAYEAQQGAAAKAAQAQAEADRQARVEIEKARMAGGNQLELARIEAAAKTKAEVDRMKAQAEIETAAKDKAREESATLSIRKLYPTASSMVPVLSGIVAGATGGKIRGASVARHNAELESMIPRWKAAVDARDPILAKSFESSVNALRSKGPGGGWAAAGAGAGEGALIGLLPEEIDIGRGVPHAMERALSTETLLRGLTTGAMGAGAAAAAGIGARARGIKKEPVGDYGPETQALTGANQNAITQADAYRSYQDALNRNAVAANNGATDVSINAAKNKGLLATAEADAEALPGLLAQQRQSAADAARTAVPVPPPAGAPAAQSGGPPVPPVSVQPPQRQLPPPEPAQNRSLPPPEKQPRQWANIWSDPARDAVLQFRKENPGVPLEALSAPMLRGMIIARLPQGAPQPSAALVRDRLSKLKDAAGRGTAVTSERDLAGLMATDPRRSTFSIAGPAISAGMGLGLMSDWPGQ